MDRGIIIRRALVIMDPLNVSQHVSDGHLSPRYDVLGTLPSSFTIKMRGVPFEATQKEIFEV